MAMAQALEKISKRTRVIDMELVSPFFNVHIYKTKSIEIDILTFKIK